MKSFTHVVNDELGIHARPAGILVKAAGRYKNTEITLEKDGAKADMKKLFRVMGLSVKHGDTVTVSADGAEEDAAIAELQSIFTEQL